jgi:guanine nucleotide-binding protein alpha-1 subunit
MYDVGGTRSSVSFARGFPLPPTSHDNVHLTGCRMQRAHWYPYFDDMDAIIFLAPISSFDERLREDRRVNRLEDTYMLWQTLCSLQMLAKTQIILFLNKCDLLEQKLRAGVQVRTHVPSFGDRGNDIDTVKKCQRSVSSRLCASGSDDRFLSDFQAHFKEIAKQHSPEQRRYYVHLTSVVVCVHYDYMGMSR